MEEAPQNSKDLPHSAHANGMSEWITVQANVHTQIWTSFLPQFTKN